MKRIFLYTLPIAAGWLVSCSRSYKTYDADRFDEWLRTDSSIQLVDVRTAAEYAEGAIPGAILLDVKRPGFIDRADSLLDVARPVAVYCKGGVRSRKAARQLAEKGYRVYNLDKGYDSWKALPHPTGRTGGAATDSASAVQPLSDTDGWPCELVLSADTFPTDVETIFGTIYNHTDYEATFGSYDYLERETEPGRWEKVVIRPDDGHAIAYTAIAYILPAHGKADFSSSLWPSYHRYEPGHYRLCKEVELTLFADLRLTEPGQTVASGPEENAESENRAAGSTYVRVAVRPDILPLDTPSVTFDIANRSSATLELADHFFVLAETADRVWERYYYPSMNSSRPASYVRPGQTASYRLSLQPALSKAHAYGRPLYKDRHFYRPGCYRLCQYAVLQLQKDFYLVDTPEAIAAYRKNPKEPISRPAP